MYFCSKDVEKNLPIYRMNFFDGKLHIEFKGRMFSFSTDHISKDDKEILENVITAFLKTNPSGFGKITHKMLEAYNNRLNLRPYPSKSLLTLIERIANRLAYYTLLDPSSISNPIRDFVQTHEFPFLDVPSSYYEMEWVDSYYPAPNECWIIELTPEKLIKVSQNRPETNITFVYTCTPDVEKGERILSPSIFVRAMRRFVELDTKKFEETFKIIKAHYDALPPACNMHYYQLCLMADVYEHFELDMHQVSMFCPWIDYD